MNGSGNPIMDSLKSKMKMMNLKEQMDEMSTVTSPNSQRARESHNVECKAMFFLRLILSFLMPNHPI